MNTKTTPAKLLHIFKPGRHVAMDGRVWAFSESDIAATAAAYDAAKHEAPLVLGAKYFFRIAISFSDQS